MGRTDALRRLSKTLPTPREIEKILDSLRSKDDIHLAVISVSIVEAKLEQLIVTRLKTADKVFVNRLFENKGPLSDFNSKILVAQGFGLLTTPLADELHVMRHIRNAFAHAKMHISFSDAAVAEQVRRLRLVTSIQAKIDDDLGVPKHKTAKTAFLLAVRISLILMHEIGKKKSAADKVISRALSKK